MRFQGLKKRHRWPPRKRRGDYKQETGEPPSPTQSRKMWPLLKLLSTSRVSGVTLPHVTPPTALPWRLSQQPGLLHVLNTELNNARCTIVVAPACNCGSSVNTQGQSLTRLWMPFQISNVANIGLIHHSAILDVLYLWSENVFYVDCIVSLVYETQIRQKC